MQNADAGKDQLLIIDKVDPVILYGVKDQHLRLLEKNFPIQLIARGNRLKIRGKQTAVEQVENILNEMMLTISKNKQISTEDVVALMHIIKANSLPEQINKEMGKQLSINHQADDAILFTKNGCIKARTNGQQKIVTAIQTHDLIVIIGPAGTGKTYTAVALAVAALKEKLVKKIILARPAVEAGESLGFLPGDYKEKIDPYLRPLYDALEEMLPRELIKKYIEQGVIEVLPLAYMRGRTLNNAFVILDEAQNATSGQMKMFLTRLGAYSKAIINGDITQIDLPSTAKSGLLEIQEILKLIEGIEFVYLGGNDVVRHRLVRDIIQAYDQHSQVVLDYPDVQESSEDIDQ